MISKQKKNKNIEEKWKSRGEINDERGAICDRLRI